MFLRGDIAINLILSTKIKSHFQIKNREILLMPVPSSYNDITQDSKIRDHVGLVWYDRTFFVPKSWNDNNTRVFLRFSSVSYAAQVVSSKQRTLVLR